MGGIDMLKYRLNRALDLEPIVFILIATFSNNILILSLNFDFRHPPDFQQPDLVEINRLAFCQKQAPIIITNILAKDYTVL